MPPLFVYIVSKVKVYVVENYDRLTPRSQLVSFIIFRGMKKKLAEQGLVVIVAKGQLISKANCQAEDSSKNERMNSFLLVCDVFSFVFRKNPRPEKNVSRLSDL